MEKEKRKKMEKEKRKKRRAGMKRDHCVSVLFRCRVYEYDWLRQRSLGGSLFLIPLLVAYISVSAPPFS